MMYLTKQINVVSDDRASWRVAVCLMCVALIAVAFFTRDALAQEAADPVQFDLHGVVVDDASGQVPMGAFVSPTASMPAVQSGRPGSVMARTSRASSISTPSGSRPSRSTTSRTLTCSLAEVLATTAALS